MERIAVIGGGAAGLGAAWSLSRRHHVTLYEAAGHLGGHAQTVVIDVDGQSTAVDTGFMVYNEVNYPLLTRLFDVLGVPTQPSSMSFSVSIDDGAFEYAGNLRGLLAQPTNLAHPGFWRMLWDIRRFNRDATALARRDLDTAHITLSEFARRQRYSRQFSERYLLPMGAAIWSASLDTIADYPASQFSRFFNNHGLLQLRNRPLWRTVTGGSREYVRRMRETMQARVLLNQPAIAVRRRPGEIRVLDRGGEVETYDQVVLATHADTTLRLLGDQASDDERRILGKIRYSRNRALLHMDPRLMPKRKRVWSSWNYVARAVADGREAVSVTYWLNRLQRLSASRPVLISLNPMPEPRSDLILGEFEYDHPILDRATIAAQRELTQLQGMSRSWFCGAYFGYGFHEDALRSGFDVAAALHSPVPWNLERPRIKGTDESAVHALAEAAE